MLKKTTQKNKQPKNSHKKQIKAPKNQKTHKHKTPSKKLKKLI